MILKVLSYVWILYYLFLGLKVVNGIFTFEKERK